MQYGCYELLLEYYGANAVNIQDPYIQYTLAERLGESSPVTQINRDIAQRYYDAGFQRFGDSNWKNPLL